MEISQISKYKKHDGDMNAATNLRYLHSTVKILMEYNPCRREEELSDCEQRLKEWFKNPANFSSRLIHLWGKIFAARGFADQKELYPGGLIFI